MTKMSVGRLARLGHIAEQPEVQAPELSPERKAAELVGQVEFFQRAAQNATSRKARLEDVMQRLCAKKWDAAKKAKMVRKLVAAEAEINQCNAALNQLLPQYLELPKHKRVGTLPLDVKVPASVEETTPEA